MTLENLIRLLGQLKDEIGDCWIEDVDMGGEISPSEIYAYFAIVTDKGKKVALAMQKLSSLEVKEEVPKSPGANHLADLFPDLGEGES